MYTSCLQDTFARATIGFLVYKYTIYSIVARALGLVAARASKGILNTRVGRDYVILLIDDTGCLARGGLVCKIPLLARRTRPKG